MTQPKILTVDDLPPLIGAYVQHSGIALTGLSLRAFNDPRAIANILKGKRDVASRRLKALVQWFSDHWPAEAPWPDTIPRPPADADGPASIARLLRYPRDEIAA